MKFSISGGVADVYEVPPGVRVIVENYDEGEEVDEGHTPCGTVRQNTKGETYVDAVYAGAGS